MWTPFYIKKWIGENSAPEGGSVNLSFLPFLLASIRAAHSVRIFLKRRTVLCGSAKFKLFND
jgi:hypothetical protein